MDKGGFTIWGDERPQTYMKKDHEVATRGFATLDS